MSVFEYSTYEQWRKTQDNKAERNKCPYCGFKSAHYKNAVFHKRFCDKAQEKKDDTKRTDKKT